MTSRQIVTPEEILVGHPGAICVLVTVYADLESPATPWVSDAAGACHPRQAGLADHRMIAVSASWPEHRPYGTVLEVLGRVKELARAAGWTPAAGVEGILDTGTIVDDLRVIDDWPAEPAACGYNAARGLLIELEQTSKAVAYSAADLAKLRELALAVYRLL